MEFHRRGFVFVFESEFFDCFVDCFAFGHDFVFSDAGEFVVRVIRYAFAHGRDAFAVFDFALFFFLGFDGKNDVGKDTYDKSGCDVGDGDDFFALRCKTESKSESADTRDKDCRYDERGFCFRRGRRFAAF